MDKILTVTSDIPTPTELEPIVTEPSPIVEPQTIQITVQSLLEAGAHFGHKTANWNPKMAQYLYGSRNDVYIFNLEHTLDMWHKAREVIVETISSGGKILMVGAKRQCQAVLKREAERCGAFYVSHKWVGGTLTNFNTVKASIRKMKNLRKFLIDVELEDSRVRINKKEKLYKQRELIKLERQFGGIETMRKMPDLIFIVDITKHENAVHEAQMHDIPIVALVDSNANPTTIDYIIPANDDSKGSLALFISNVADAVLEGKELREQELRSKQESSNDPEIEQEAKQLKEKTDGIKEVPREKRRPRNSSPRNKRGGASRSKRKISSGVTFYTLDHFKKENS